MISDQVFVRFGATTSDLDKASDKAVGDIRKVSNEVKSTESVFASLKDRLSNLFSRIPGVSEAQVMFRSVKTGADGATKSLSGIPLVAQAVRTSLGGVGAGGAEAAVGLGAVEAAGGGLGPVLGGVATTVGLLTVGLVALAAVAGGLAFAGLYSMSKGLADAGQEVDKLSQKLGMSYKEVQQWGLIAKNANVDAGALQFGVQQLSRNMVLAANGSKRQSAAFKEIGIDAKNAKSNTETFLALADKFQNMENGPKKTALAMAVLGQRGTELIPVLNKGSEGLREMMKAAEETGAVMSDDLIAASKELDDNLETVSMGTTGLKNILMEALAPAMIWVTEKVADWVKAMVESYRTGGMVRKIVDVMVIGIKVLITVTYGLGAVFVAAFKVIIGAVSAGFQAVKTFANVMALVGTGNFAEAMKVGWQGATGAINTLNDSIKGAWGTAKGASTDIAKLWSGKMPKGAPSSGDYGGDTDVDLGGGGRTKKGSSKKKDNSDSEAKRAAREALQAKLEALDRELAATEGNFEAEMEIERKKLELIKGFYGEGSKQYEAQLGKMEALERKHAEKIKEIKREAIDHQAELSQIELESVNQTNSMKLEAERQRLDQELALGRISSSQRQVQEQQVLNQEYQMEVQHENAVFALKVQAMRDKLALLPTYSDAYRRMLQDIETAERQHNARMKGIQQNFGNQTTANNNKVTNAYIQKWQNTLAPIGSAVTGALNSILTRTATIKQALISMCDQILTSFVGMAVQMGVNWLATQLGIRAASAATGVTETTQHAITEQTKLATTMGTNFAQILSYAPVAGAAAFASTAAIPIVGPVLAPAAAATATAAVAAMAPLAFAREGYDIPAGTNPLTQLHEKEMVLPAYLADPLRKSLSSPSFRASNDNFGIVRPDKSSPEVARPGGSGPEVARPDKSSPSFRTSNDSPEVARPDKSGPSFRTSNDNLGAARPGGSGPSFRTSNDNFGAARPGGSGAARLGGSGGIRPSIDLGGLRQSLSEASPRASGGLAATTMAGVAQTRSEMASRGPGDMHATYSPTVNGNRSLEQMVQEEGRFFRRWINNQWRNGTIGPQAKRAGGRK